MKFQKDNSNDRLTEAILTAREDAAQLLLEERAAALEAIRIGREEQSALLARMEAYPPISDQLDLLWNDIEAGRIQANTTAPGTWYQTIKEVKANNPLP